MARRRGGAWILLLVVSVLVGAIVLPPLININRYHRRIAESISGAVGRPVHMSGLRLVVLPRPGFELSDFVVEEDPAFGAEPVLRSPSVVASVRLGSLWRGRLEIARIQLDEPSVNLVRRRDGQWNVGSVLVQAARTPNAPTAQKHAGGTLRFPYIVASNARINFKFGEEKLPFSFLNADLSVWLAQPNEWQLRFEAQPVRTDLDLNLADTGVVRVEGSIRRAALIKRMPLNLAAQWSGASLGQLSRLVAGYDPGWRGTLDLRGTVTGYPEDALIKARVRGSGIHRVEFESDSTLEVSAACELHYRHAIEAIEGLTCLAPVGDGQMLLTGAIHDIGNAPSPALALGLDKVPVASIFRAVQLVRRTFPAGLLAAGDVDGHFTFDRALAEPLAGEATVSKLTVAAEGLKQPLVFAGVTATAAPAAPPPALSGRSSRRTRLPAKPRLQASGSDGARREPSLEISPLSLAARGDPPLTLTARFAGSGFELHLAGAAPVSRLAALNRSFQLLPLPSGSLGPEGSATLDLILRSPWLLPVSDESPGAQAAAPGGLVGVSPRPALQQTPLQPGELTGPRIDGTIQLRDTELTTSFLAAPIQIVTAQGTFTGDRVNWQPLSIDYGPLHAEGSFLVPLRPSGACLGIPGCTRHFDLHVDSLDVATLQATLLGARRGQLVEEILTRLTERPRPWPPLEGTLHVDTLTLNAAMAETLTLHRATAAVTAAGNQLTLNNVTAQTLGGVLTASGTVDASGDLPTYALQLGVDGADAEQAAALFQEKWGGGVFRLNTAVHLEGFTMSQLAGSAAGMFHCEWTGHGWAGHGGPRDPEVLRSEGVEAGASAASTPLDTFDSWVADGTIAGHSLNLDHSSLSPAPFPIRRRGSSRAARRPAETSASVPVRGSISFGRELSLQVGAGSTVQSVGGTLQHPVIAPAGGPASGSAQGPAADGGNRRR